MRGLFFLGAHGGRVQPTLPNSQDHGVGIQYLQALAASSLASADVTQLLSHLPATERARDRYAETGKQ
jgi:hypothetical protein